MQVQVHMLGPEQAEQANVEEGEVALLAALVRDEKGAEVETVAAPAERAVAFLAVSVRMRREATRTAELETSMVLLIDGRLTSNKDLEK